MLLVRYTEKCVPGAWRRVGLCRVWMYVVLEEGCRRTFRAVMRCDMNEENTNEGSAALCLVYAAEKAPAAPVMRHESDNLTGVRLQ